MKPLHDLCKLFPPIDGEEFDALCADIKANGLLNPIVLLDGAILDGRNRALACEKVGVKPTYLTFGGADPLGFVISQNVQRRHLTVGQRALIAVEIKKVFAVEADARRRRANLRPNPDAGRTPTPPRSWASAKLPSIKPSGF